MVDAVDPVSKALLLLLVVLLIDAPHFSLLIDVFFIGHLALLLLSHLGSQEVAHFLLLILHTVGSLLLEVAESEFTFVLISHQHIFLVLLLVRHLGQYSICHFIHKFLRTSLPLLHFHLPVKILFVQHPAVLFKGIGIVILLLIVLFLLNLFLFLVFLEHPLEVLTLLLSLLSLDLTLLLHFHLQTVDIFLLLVEQLLGLSLLSPLLILHLLISRHLVL